jgi:hypothetical protein
MSGQSFEFSPLEWFEHAHTPKQPPSDKLVRLSVLTI